MGEPPCLLRACSVLQLLLLYNAEAQQPPLLPMKGELNDPVGATLATRVHCLEPRTNLTEEKKMRSRCFWAPNDSHFRGDKS